MTTTAERVDNPVQNPVVMPGRHGGTLRRGGTNKNAGRRPDRIRKLAQQLLEPRIRLLAHFADGVAVQQHDGEFKVISPTPAERTRAIEALHKIGMGEQVAVSEVRARMRAQIARVMERETWTRDELLAALGEIWK